MVLEKIAVIAIFTLCLAYLIAWFYGLFTFVIPVLSVPLNALGGLLSLTVWQIIFIILFFSLGVIGVFFAVFILIIIIVGS